LKPDEQLPSVRALAKQMTINPNTIQKAYSELENQGYIYSVVGKGNYVSPSVSNPNTKQLKHLEKELVKISAEMQYLGMSKEEIIEIISKIDMNLKGGGAGD
jgi:GntR family transcriptional regulator